MRRLILGMLLGATLSGLRARAGQSLLEFPAPGAFATYGIRALALLSCALSLFHARRLFHARHQSTLLLLGVALGYAAVGFVILPARSSTGPVDLAALVVLPPLLARLLRGRGTAPIAEQRTLGLGAVGGLALCAAGATLALEGTARELRLLGSAATLDDTIFGSVFLALVAFGGLAFARTLAQFGDASTERDWGRDRAIEVALVVAAGLTLLSQRGLLGLSTHVGLRDFVRRYGQDSFDIGMLGYDALLATAVYIAPAFAVGAALGCARRASELAALALGSALALLALPLRMASDGLDPATAATSADLVREGVVLAVLGAVATTLLRRDAGGGPARALTWIVAAASLAALFALPPLPVVVAAPWRRLPTAPSLVFETAAGQVSISPGGADLDVVEIAGTSLTPDVARAAADRNRIVSSMELLPVEVRARGAKVLLVGQLTPGRALTLTDLGARTIDRTASWSAIMPALEAQLFEARGHPLPSGEVLAPGDARERLDAYDLVLALTTQGEAPLIPRDLPSSTKGAGSPLVVLWIDAGHGVHRRSLPGPVLLAADGVEHLGVAVVSGLSAAPGERIGPGPVQHALFAPGEPIDRTLVWREREVRGPRRHEIGLFYMMDRLARANADNPLGEFARGLSLHYRVQRRSSMFETREQKIEIDFAALDVLSEALRGSARAPVAFEREAWGGLARVLVGQRKVAAIYEYLEPLVERWAPWPALQIALAHADLESLLPEDALGRLAGVVEQPGSHRGLALEMLARARSETGDHAGAATALRQLGLYAPSGWQERQLGIEATLAGEPDGREILERVLADDPADEEVRALLEDGIPPAGPGPPSPLHLNHSH